MDIINNNLKVIWNKVAEISSSFDNKLLSEQIERISKEADLESRIDEHNTLTIFASGYLPAYRFVNFNGILCSSVDKVLGVTTEPIEADTYGKIVFTGIVYVETGGPIIAVGGEVRASMGGGGRADNSPISFQNILALDTAKGAGELIRVKL